MKRLVVGRSTRVIPTHLLAQSEVISGGDLMDGRISEAELNRFSQIIFASYFNPVASAGFSDSLLLARRLSAALADKSRLLFLSTDAVFDGRAGRYRVDETPCPNTPYGRIKAAQEDIFRGSVIFRFTTFGPSFSNRPLITETILERGRKVVLQPNSYFSPISTLSVGHVLELHGLGRLSPAIYHAAIDPISKEDLFRRIASAMNVSLESARVEAVQDSDHSLVPSPGLRFDLDTEIELARDYIAAHPGRS